MATRSYLFRGRLLIFVILLVAVVSVTAQSGNQLIEGLITIYTRAYPEIEFRLLNTMEDYDRLLPLTKSLGEDLSNLDYEHPKEVRITLVEAQQYRIATLLYHDVGSATLFKTPSAAVTEKPYTCLITSNRKLLDEDPLAATRFMYGLPETILESMPESLRISNHDLLLYAVDHEVFHCVDAYVNGPL